MSQQTDPQFSRVGAFASSARPPTQPIPPEAFYQQFDSRSFAYPFNLIPNARNSGMWPQAPHPSVVPPSPHPSMTAVESSAMLQTGDKQRRGTCDSASGPPARRRHRGRGGSTHSAAECCGPVVSVCYTPAVTASSVEQSQADVSSSETFTAPNEESENVIVISCW
jgi:hypothetical protein